MHSYIVRVISDYVSNILLQQQHFKRNAIEMIKIDSILHQNVAYRKINVT